MTNQYIVPPQPKPQPRRPFSRPMPRPMPKLTFATSATYTHQRIAELLETMDANRGTLWWIESARA